MKEEAECRGVIVQKDVMKVEVDRQAYKLYHNTRTNRYRTCETKGLSICMWLVFACAVAYWNRNKNMESES